MPCLYGIFICAIEIPRWLRHKNAQVQCHESYNPHESALASKGKKIQANSINPCFLITPYEEPICMSCPRSTAKFGEVARPEGADDAAHVPGARGAEERRSGARGWCRKPKSTHHAADSGDKDQFRACDCDLRSTVSLNKPFRLYIFNKLEGLTEKKKKSFETP